MAPCCTFQLERAVSDDIRSEGDRSAKRPFARIEDILLSRRLITAEDIVRAHMWFNLSAISGNKVSIRERSLAASKMTPQQIAEAQNLALECHARNLKNCD